MIKVRILATGTVQSVTRNEAYGLIDRGEAEIVNENQLYNTREMRAGNQVRDIPSKKSAKSSKTYKSK